MKSKSAENLFRYGRIALAAVSLAALPGCGVDNMSYLRQKCLNGDAVDVNGVLVSSFSLTLDKGSATSIAGATFTSEGGDNVTINSSYNVRHFSDGRFVVKESGALWNPDKVIAVNITPASDQKTRINFTLNCKDTTQVPPDIRNRTGFSPDRNGTKPALQAYRGFGNR